MSLWHELIEHLYSDQQHAVSFQPTQKFPYPTYSEGTLNYILTMSSSQPELILTDINGKILSYHFSSH